MKRNGIAIRPLEASDPVRIAGSFGAIGWNKPVGQYERYWTEQQAGHRDAFVATVDGKFAGYVTLRWQPTYPPFQADHVPEIQDLNVLPRFRRRGVGSALMDSAEGAARTRSKFIGIGVGLASDYGAAQRLYIQRGYVPDGHGVAYRDRTVEYGDQVSVDDDLVLYLIKRLSE